MNLQARPLTDIIGAEIIGVDLGEPIDEETRSRLHRYFADALCWYSAIRISPG